MRITSSFQLGANTKMAVKLDNMIDMSKLKLNYLIGCKC